MIRLMARKRQVARLPAAVLCLLLLSAMAAVAARDLDTAEEIMVNNVWIDTPLTQVFRDISIETGVVIAVGPQVPDILVSLDAGLGKPLQECFRELAAGQGLFIHQKNKRFYLITSGDPASPAFMEVASSKRLYLKYISAKHLRASLPRSMQQYITSGERPNEVLIYAVPEIIKRIMEIVTKLDIPRRQVVLEVLIVELQEEASEEFGLDWEYSDRHNTFSMERGLGTFTGIARYTSVPANEFTSLLFTLRALVGEKKAKIRSRPRVATLNGQKATIEISLDEYFTIVTDIYGTAGTLRTELEVIKSGVLLNITPHIGDNGDITVDVLTEVSDVASRQNQIEGNVSGDLPMVRRRKAETTVRVKEGDAIVIAGLIETQETSEDRRIPVLSSIPFVGGLFTSKENTTIKKEVIIFITPRLMAEGEIVLSDRHQLIDEVGEIEGLQNVATATDVRHRYRQNLRSAVEKEIEELREVVALLDGQNQLRHDSLDIDGEGEITLSNRYYLLNAAEEIEALREVVALLDVEP